MRAHHVEAIASLIFAAHSEGDDGGGVAREIVATALLEAMPGLALGNFLKSSSSQSSARLLCFHHAK